MYLPFQDGEFPASQLQNHLAGDARQDPVAGRGDEGVAAPGEKVGGGCLQQIPVPIHINRLDGLLTAGLGLTENGWDVVNGFGAGHKAFHMAGDDFRPVRVPLRRHGFDFADHHQKSWSVARRDAVQADAAGDNDPDIAFAVIVAGHGFSDDFGERGERMGQLQADEPCRALQAEQVILKVKGQAVIGSEKIKDTETANDRKIIDGDLRLVFFNELTIDVVYVHKCFLKLGETTLFIPW